MKEEIKKAISKAIEKLYPEHKDIEFSVDYAPANIDADFASNAAMVLAEKVGKKPMEAGESLKVVIARNAGTKQSHGIAAPLLGQLGARNETTVVEVALPGFLNFLLSGQELLENLNRITKNPEAYGRSDIGKGKLAIVEYFQLNVAKPPHVGHLRSAVIGDALKRLLSFVGYKTVSDTHIGDWGTQLGAYIFALKRLPSEQRGLVIKDIHASAAVYADFSKEIEKDPAKKELGKREFVQLEKGDPENRKYWKQIVKTAKEELEKQAGNLKLLAFDFKDLGESFYQDKMPKIMERLAESGSLKTGEKTGEKYVDLEKSGLGRLICIKSDGASTYELRDLATLAYRYDELTKKEKAQLAWNLYIVDKRQSHDFQQVFKVMEMLGYDTSKSKHIDFGYMSLPEGPISTRKGNVISLEKLISEAKNRALEIIKEKNPDLRDQEKVAEQVGLAAVKYFDLKHNRRSDIVFDWNEALSFQGNTGPYLQYTYARFRSILRKAKIKESINDIEYHQYFRPERYKLLRKLYYFPEIVVDSARDFMPSILAHYLYELAETANSFYHEFPVTQEKDEKMRMFRLALVKATAAVLKNGLNLLGIEGPEEM